MPELFGASRGTLYFSAENAEQGRELWSTRPGQVGARALCATSSRARQAAPGTEA